MPWMDSGLIIAGVLVGSFATIILDLARKMPTTTRWLRKLFPDQSAAWYARVDFILVWVLGSAAAYFLFNPKDTQQAFMSGLGCVSTIRLAAGNFESQPPRTKDGRH